MEWFKTYTNMARTVEFSVCDDVQQATWFKLLCYCVDLENGGIISNCDSWNDRMCQVTLGCTRDAIQSECELYRIVDGSLHVFGYPDEEIEHQKAVSKSRSRAGRRSGESRRKTQSKQSNEHENEQMLNTSSNSVRANVEQKERERDKKDKKEAPKPPNGVEEEDDRWVLLNRVWQTGKVGPDRWPWDSWFDKLRQHPDFDCARHGSGLVAELIGMKEKEVGSPPSWFSAAIRRVLEGPRRYSGDFTGSENSNPALAGSPFEVL